MSGGLQRERAGSRPFVVAIDGPAASGKGTLAHRLGEQRLDPAVESAHILRVEKRL